MIPAIVQQRLKEKLGASLQFQPVGGGSINEAWQISTGLQVFFCKTNTTEQLPGLFQKEGHGLKTLAATEVIRIPAVIYTGEEDAYQWLVLEWIRPGIRHESFWKLFGEQLAALHTIKSDAFGYEQDNYMGSLPQQNQLSLDWPYFFVHQRLMPQVKLARDNGLLTAQHAIQFEGLYKHLHTIFTDEPPALLHGDLWSGNFLCDEQGRPVLIDPAVYYGNRHIDMAMTTLFGGFDEAFYAAYHYHYPLPSNYRDQWEICNLYPLLIHLNLFGSSYLHEIAGTIKKYG